MQYFDFQLGLEYDFSLVIIVTTWASVGTGRRKHSAAKPGACVRELGNFQHEVVNVLTLHAHAKICPRTHAFRNVCGQTPLASGRVGLELLTAAAVTRESCREDHHRLHIDRLSVF